MLIFSLIIDIDDHCWYYSDELSAYVRLYILPPGTDVVVNFKLLHLSQVTYGTTGCWEPWDHHFLAIVDLVCITVFINLYLLTILFADA